MDKLLMGKLAVLRSIAKRNNHGDVDIMGATLSQIEDILTAILDDPLHNTEDDQ
jgi:hypothetical protein